MHKIKYIRNINKLPQLSQQERDQLAEVTARYAFRANEYYLSLIDWDNPADPIRRIIIPSIDELDAWGDLDISNEKQNYKAPGLQHKYNDTVLLILNKACGSYCRFCFRKRIFMEGNIEVVNDVQPGIEYIKEHVEISDVILTGGEPLLLSTHKLEAIISTLRNIPHIQIIRIGTKIPVFNPYRILDDWKLLSLMRRFSTAEKKIYIMMHINHPQELSEPAIRALEGLLDAGTILCNQTAMLRGINDNPDTLHELITKLSFTGVTPYYFFINRPTEGNKTFAIPITEAYTIFNEASKGSSGLARRARLVMSHKSGKIEVVGLTDEHIFLKYNRARNPEDEFRMMVFERDDEAYWFDDLKNQVEGS
ncbi:MAG: KamA family radical SAM protein [candidate division Zixibacteria bacterium]|nr:KamA family radical SAM protein [Candidatus Tariuqbacter arcticus]